jgi:hypothetical protein
MEGNLEQTIFAFQYFISQWFWPIIPVFHLSNIPLSLFFFCAPVKNLLDLVLSLDKAGKQRELTF